MTTYTTQPSAMWGDGYTDILENGVIMASVPAGREAEHIAHTREVVRRHFQEIVDRKERGDDRLVIAAGCAYLIGSPNDDPKGFGGTRWRIMFYGGRPSVVCNSLWHLGEIPDEWREQLPNNATLREIR